MQRVGYGKADGLGFGAVVRKDVRENSQREAESAHQIRVCKRSARGLDCERRRIAGRRLGCLSTEHENDS